MIKKIDNKGFTLIELIVVIGILGLLAAIAIPRIMNVQENAIEVVDKTNRSILKNAGSLSLILEGNPDSNVLWKSDGEKIITEKKGSDTHRGNDYLELWPEHPKKGKDYILIIDKEGKIKIEP